MIEPKNDQEALKTFIEQIRWLYEPEYGDFKRKVGLYIQRLEETHPELTKGRAKDVFAEIKQKVVYNPSGDIEVTRRQILQMAHELLTAPGSGQIH